MQLYALLSPELHGWQASLKMAAWCLQGSRGKVVAGLA